MTRAKVSLVQRLSCMPNEKPGEHPIIKINTDLPHHTKNFFYMDLVDLDGVPIKLDTDHPPAPTIDPSEINSGDDIEFDVQDGLLRKVVLWKGRKIRQRGYSGDEYATASD